MSKDHKPTRQTDGSTCDLLTCTVCLEPYDDIDRLPKLLSCHHSFCNSCLVTLSTGSQLKMVICPVCREKTMLPPGGISKLQTNFYVAQIKEVFNGSAEQSKNSCSKHERRELILFCSSCEQSLCEECYAENHAGHQVRPVDEALMAQRQLMQSEIASSWNLVVASNRLRTVAEAEARILLASKQRAEEDLYTAFAIIEEAVRQRKTELQNELNTAYRGRHEVIISRMEEAKKLSTALGGLVEMCQQTLTSATIDNLVAHRVKLASKTQEMQRGNKTELPQVSSITFRSDKTENMTDIVNSFGRIVTEKPIPSSSVVKEVEAVACQISTVIIRVTDFDNSELRCHYPLEVEVTDLYDDVIQCSLKHVPDGQYLITFRPQISGPHCITVRLWHYVINTCAVIVRSNDPILVYGNPEKEQEQMQYPRDIAVDNSGNVYIADSGNGRILKYDGQGALLLEFPISDSEEDYSICGLALDHQRGTVVCIEVLLNGSDPSKTRAILKYSTSGKLLSRTLLQDILSKGFSLAINSLGQVLIADTEQDAIFVFDVQGRFLKRFGETGTNPSHFCRPTFISIGKDDTIIVTDSGNSRIQVFDKSGRFMYSFGQKGTRKGQFSLPFGVTADRFGNILVVDGANYRVQVFEHGGQCIGCIESIGNKLNAPRGIDVTSDGHVFVADRDNHCIKKYKYL